MVLGLQQKGEKVTVVEDLICCVKNHLEGFEWYVSLGKTYTYGKSPEQRTRDTQDSSWGSRETVREVSEECLASLAI